MKTKLSTTLLLLSFFAFQNNAISQVKIPSSLKSSGKRIERKAQKRVEKNTTKKVEESIDNAFEGKKKDQSSDSTKTKNLIWYKD